MVHVKKAFILEYEIEKWMCTIPSVVCVSLGGIVVYFSVTLSRISSILVVLPLIIFVVASIIFTFDLVNYSMCNTITQFGVLLSVVAYVWAFVVTIVYWKSQHFNARAQLLNVSQLIPLIG